LLKASKTKREWPPQLAAFYRAPIIHRLRLIFAGFRDYSNRRVVGGAFAMVDHLAWAKNYRERAANCEAASKNTSSKDFASCYQQLSDLYRNCAKLEEDFFERMRKREREEALTPSNYSIQVTPPKIGRLAA
jgi:hypothetical protein